MNTSSSHPHTQLDLGCVKLGPGHYSFAIHSRLATRISLVLLDSQGSQTEIPFDNKLNRTGDIWKLELKDLSPDLLYAFKIDGPPEANLLFSQTIADPYSKTLCTPSNFLSPPTPICYTFSQLPSSQEDFDWQNDLQSLKKSQRSIIYEVHVRSFTQDPSSLSKNPGTFLGLLEKIDYLKSLGITAIELLPIFEWDETHHFVKDQKNISSAPLCNYWGYAPLNFFCPSRRLSSSKTSPQNEFKTFVRELHKANIEVILDVVFNHTGSENLSPFFTLDKKGYYILSPQGSPTNYSGCGNTLSANQTPCINLIINSLRYWTQEFHIDGFRFDLTSCLTRSPKGELLDFPPILELISNDPILSQTTLIAEPWDASNGYRLGFFANFSKKWKEWNGFYRDSVRSFLNGNTECISNFAYSLLGSPHIFSSSSPENSINFITCHDGFSLKDLVSYNSKHNENNQEENQDGTEDNRSFNFGEEGPSSNPVILEYRTRQMKNFFLALFSSLGTPMILSGDEYGHSGAGNNNRWCHDSPLNYFSWQQLEKEPELLSFLKRLILFRKEHQDLFSHRFLLEEEFDWLDQEGALLQELTPSHFFSWKIKSTNYHLFIAFNTSKDEIPVQFPSPSPTFSPYSITISTWNIKRGGEENPSAFIMPPFSSIIGKSHLSVR